MVGETNSMVGYHLMIEGHSIQLGSGGRGGGTVSRPAGPQQHPDNNITNNNIFGVSHKITIKSQPQVPYKVVPY